MNNLFEYLLSFVLKLLWQIKVIQVAQYEICNENLGCLVFIRYRWAACYKASCCSIDLEYVSCNSWILIIIGILQINNLQWQLVLSIYQLLTWLENDVLYWLQNICHGADWQDTITNHLRFWTRHWRKNKSWTITKYQIWLQEKCL